MTEVVESKRIVIASPDAKLCKALEKALTASGHPVLTTDNGFKVVQLLDSEAVGGLVLHVKLQGQAGLQVAGVCKASRVNSRIPVVMLAEESTDEVVRRMKQLGLSTLFLPPFSVPDIIKSLDLDKPRAAKAASPDGYDVRIINAFTEALGETLEFYFTQKLPLGKAGVKSSEQALGYLSSLISFTGEAVKGSMAMSFDRKFLVELSMKVFPDQKVELNDSMFADMAGEMANQVCGAVKLKLSKLGVKVMIGLPQVVIGEKHRVVHIVKNPVIWMPVNLAPDTKASVEFCMSKNEEGLVLEEEKNNTDIQSGDILMF